MRRLLLAVILLPVLSAAKCGKKPPDDSLDTDIPDIPPPSVKLQVAGVDPAFASANREFRAEVFGSHFDEGAKVSLSGAAVPTTYKDDANLQIAVPALPLGSYDVTVQNPDGQKATLRKGLTLTEPRGGPSCSPTIVYFDFDSAVLAGETRSTIESAAACLRETQADARLEGHTDDRGTTDYNIALAQRRAESVARYLAGLGVSPGRMKSVSYGEERPVDTRASADAYAKNRRVEIVPKERP